MATVSAILPSYNHARYVGDALESVLRQTRPADEVLVVDDGSGDDTATVVARFGDRVRFVPRPHAGIGATYNAGVAAARCDVIAWLESDDLWEDGYLAATVGFLEAHPEAGWVGTARRLVDGQGEPIGIELHKRTPGSWFTTESCLVRDLGFSSTPVVRRASLLDVGPYDTTTFLADNDMMLRFSLRQRMAYIDDPLYLHRRHATNTSGNLERDAREMIAILTRLGTTHAAALGRHGRLLCRCLAKYQGMAAMLALRSDSGGDPSDVMQLLSSAVRNHPTKSKHLRRWLGARLLGPARYAALRRALHRGRPSRPG